MNSLVVSGLVLLVLLLLAVFWSNGKKGKGLPYDLQETLFSPAERAFLAVLEPAIGDKARIFAKVSVADVLVPAAGMGKSKLQQALAQIGTRRFDYLLCHPADLSFICAIELDDRAHRHQKRRERDTVLKAACDSAGLPLLQIPAAAHYQLEELRQQIAPLLIRATASQPDQPLPGERREPTFSPLLLDGVDMDETRHGGGRSPASSRSNAAPVTDDEPAENLFADQPTTAQSGPHCPRCDAPLVEREAKKGPHAGRLFMACSRFPECRYAAPHYLHQG